MRIPHIFRPQVIQLFDQMDFTYDAAARKTGFVCHGCRDNCCMTRFYHHTLVEYLHIKSGLERLGTQVLADVKERAAATEEQMAKTAPGTEPARVMCPLNVAGRCMLYHYRPMICRLHGISHILRRPDGRVQTGPGCEDFYAQCGASNQTRLDRTPLYAAMAKLEQQLRKETGFDRKIKMTIAKMILDDDLTSQRFT
jgi:Fe-S-cluster containining protein